jgi:hypothetical protein
MIMRIMTENVALSPVPMLMDARTARRRLKGLMRAENMSARGLKGCSAGDLFSL